MQSIDDSQIITLYHQRNEQAIAESSRKYGGLCHRIAHNILSSYEDAKECVNDTWFAAWQRMPPDRPLALGAFFGRITRNISVSSQPLAGGSCEKTLPRYGNPAVRTGRLCTRFNKCRTGY